MILLMVFTVKIMHIKKRWVRTFKKSMVRQSTNIIWQILFKTKREILCYLNLQNEVMQNKYNIDI